MSTQRKPEIRLSAPLTLRAEPDASKLPTKFTGLAYSGGPVPRYDCVIDVNSTTVPQRMPLLAEHDRADMIGVIENSSSGANQIVVGGKLFSDMPGSTAERLAQLAQRGAPLQMSIGLFGYSEEAYAAGHSLTVNGRPVSGPITVLRGGTVREVSICTLGADPNTDVRLFRAAPTLDQQRERAIDELFAELREQPGPLERAVYRSMSAGAFAVAAADLRQLAARLTRSDRIYAALSVKSIYAKRREQGMKGGL